MRIDSVINFKLPAAKIAFGTMNAFGTFNGFFRRPGTAKVAANLLSLVHEVGIRTIDTAPIYCRGLAEHRIGSFANSDSEIWTKVGVTIGTALPKIDFSFDALSTGLLNSLARIQRNSVSVVFLHNPDAFPRQIVEVDRFSNWAKEGCFANSIGISILGASLPRYILSSREIEVVMVEHKHLPALIKRHHAWLEKRKVVVRSLFSGGSTLHCENRNQRLTNIAQTFREIDPTWPIWRFVIAPRTPTQLLDYKHIIASAEGTNRY